MEMVARVTVATLGMIFISSTAAASSAVVLDNGSQLIKAGLASDQQALLIPNVVGRVRYQFGNSYFGEDALVKRSILQLVQPTEYGLVDDYEDEVEIWKYVIQEKLETEPSAQTLVMAEPTSVPPGYQDMIMMALQTLAVPKVVFENEAVLVMRALGKPTGLVVQSGDSITTAVAVVDGQVLRETYRFVLLAGKDITTHLSHRLRMYAWESVSIDVYEQNKIQHCYVAFDYEEEMKKDLESIKVEFAFEGIPVVDVDRERFQVPEIMFRPELFDRTGAIQELAKDALQTAPSSAHDQLLENVVLSGGNTLFQGFPERFKKEFGLIMGRDATVHAPGDRQFSILQGGKTVANEL